VHEDGTTRFRFCIEEYLVGKTEDIRIRDYAAVGIEEERIAAGSREQRSNVTGC
jgi:hypothetical protein